MDKKIITFPGGNKSDERPPDSPQLTAFFLRSIASRLDRIQATLIIAHRGLAEHEDVSLESDAVDLCEESLANEIGAINKLADTLAHPFG